MGTNYYLNADVCLHCRRPARVVHIGKSAAGWCFALRIYPDDGISELDDWKRLFATGDIVDEYGKHVGPADMLRRITKRVGINKPLLHADPRGICVGPGGAGTYDLFTGEFS